MAGSVSERIREGRKSFMESSPLMRRSFSESRANEVSNQSWLHCSMAKELRIFVTTWNVGGRTPTSSLNLNDFLQTGCCADMYVCGFQEVVPLSAGNVLVMEDNEPAARWLTLINQALNNPSPENNLPSSDPSRFSRCSDSNNKESKTHGFCQKQSLKVVSKSLREGSSVVKLCNCALESSISDQHCMRKLCDSEADAPSSSSSSIMTYSLIASKQMVGIFLSVWARHDLIPHIGHARISSIGLGFMRRLGNKGCVSISMTVHKTSFCFVCSHLASGEREGDELKRNADVAEILKNSQFNEICKNRSRAAPERISDHGRIIWLGDLNYRVSLSYEETRVLLEDHDWNALLEKDQLNRERGAGKVFNGFHEGNILFPPTYKFSNNSDSYAGETVKSKKKRRTPAWCDRILWSGGGIQQLSYIRGESKFSDHRPVCSLFSVHVE